MISTLWANTALILSLLVSVGAYIFVSRREGSYINLLTPSFAISIPAYYLFPLFYINAFGTEASSYAFIYVYSALAVESVVFAYVYTRRRAPLVRLPFEYGYSNFGRLSFVALAGAVLLYLPVLLEFPQYILDPRQIYIQTRTGFGVSFYISATLAYLAVVLILFSKRSFLAKAFVILVSGLVLSLHGSKGQVLSLIFLVVIFEIYVMGRRFKLMPALAASGGIAAVGLGLFAATMVLGSPLEAIEALSEYSDYTRNAMLVIDSNIPRQYGRLTWESNTLSRVPRVLMPSKPKNFGAFYLDEEFYPEWFDGDTGSPAFGVGVQYADFGVLAIPYLAFFAALRGWLAHLFVNRLRLTRHPADFVLVAFLADVSLFPIGAGWLLPETIIVALVLRLVSCAGADRIYRERIGIRHPITPRLKPIDGVEGV
jgi:hypothetical protein